MEAEKEQPSVTPIPEPQPQPSPAEEPNLISAAFAKQEEKNTQKGLFEKAPVFSYGSAKEAISDAGMTFEELRIAKSDDFPELAEGKRGSWTVEYGKVVKAISDPKGTVIRSVKEEIERSKAFLDGLKKAKDKCPDCLVKPKVTAQSKGIAAYKGVFSTMEEARASDKTICIVPGGDGRVYELRKTDLGENKAKVLAERYSKVFGLEMEYIPGFIESENELRRLLTPESWQIDYRSTIREQVILIGAVDNNKSRQLCHKVFQQMNELIYIDSGNGEYTGQVVCGIRRSGKTYYPPIGAVYPDVLEDTDKYLDKVSGILTDGQFTDLNHSFLEEKPRLEQRLSKIEAELSGQEKPQQQADLMERAKELLKLETVP